MQHIKKNTNSSTRFCADLQNWIRKGRCPCKNEYDIDGSLFAFSFTNIKFGTERRVGYPLAPEEKNKYRE